MGLLRILIVHEPDLLTLGLRRLLEADGRFEVVSVPGGLDQVGTLLKQARPDALVVEEERLHLTLGDPPDEIALDCPSLIISLSWNDNRMRIYRLELRALAEPAELIQVLGLPPDEKSAPAT